MSQAGLASAPLPSRTELLVLQRQLRETQEAQRDNLSVVLVRRVVEYQYRSSFCRDEEGEGRLAARTPRCGCELVGGRDGSCLAPAKMRNGGRGVYGTTAQRTEPARLPCCTSVLIMVVVWRIS